MLEIATTPIGAKHRWLLFSLLSIFGASVTFDHTSGDSIFVDVFVLSGTFWIGTLIVSTYVPQIPIIRGSILAIRERYEQAIVVNIQKPADASTNLPQRTLENVVIDNNASICKTTTPADMPPNDDGQFVPEPGLNWDMLKQIWKYEEAEQRRVELREKSECHDKSLKDDSSSSVAQTTQSSSTHTADNRIIDVWAHNFEEEMEHLRMKVRNLRYVAFDTEYPGFVKECTSTKTTLVERNYDTLRENIDVIKLIQLGICCNNADGSGEEGCCWQFHFEFDRDFDEQNESSMQLLTNANIDWGRLKLEGINHHAFAKAFTKIFLEDQAWENEKGLIRYISFHGMYDFAFLVKLATQWPLPDRLEEFFQVLDSYFPLRCDLKFILNFSGSLTHLSSLYNIPRIGTAHQAGSDSLVTSAIFYALPEDIGEKGFIRGALFGLHAPFYLPPDIWKKEDVAAALQDLAEDANETVSSMAKGMVEEMDTIELEPPKDSSDESGSQEAVVEGIDCEVIPQWKNDQISWMPMVQLPVENINNGGDQLCPPLPTRSPEMSKMDPDAPSFKPGKLPVGTPPLFSEDDAPPETLPYDMALPVDFTPGQYFQPEAPKVESHLNANAAPYIPKLAYSTENAYGVFPVSDNLSFSQLPSRPLPNKQVFTGYHMSQPASKHVGVLPPVEDASSVYRTSQSGAPHLGVPRPIEHASPVYIALQHLDAPLPMERASPVYPSVQPGTNHLDAQLPMERASPVYPSVQPGTNHLDAQLPMERASPVYPSVQPGTNHLVAPLLMERASPVYPSVQPGANHLDAPLPMERASSVYSSLQHGANHRSVARSLERISRVYSTLQPDVKHHGASSHYLPSHPEHYHEQHPDNEDKTSDDSPLAWLKNYIPQKVVKQQEEFDRVVRGWRNPLMKAAHAAEKWLTHGEEELVRHESALIKAAAHLPLRPDNSCDQSLRMGHERSVAAVRPLHRERVGECAENYVKRVGKSRPFVTDTPYNKLVPCIDNQNVFVLRGESGDEHGRPLRHHPEECSGMQHPEVCGMRHHSEECGGHRPEKYGGRLPRLEYEPHDGRRDDYMNPLVGLRNDYRHSPDEHDPNSKPHRDEYNHNYPAPARDEYRGYRDEYVARHRDERARSTQDDARYDEQPRRHDDDYSRQWGRGDEYSHDGRVDDYVLRSADRDGREHDRGGDHGYERHHERAHREDYGRDVAEYSRRENHHNSGQGYDFLLEQGTRHQNLTSSSRPNKKVWQAVQQQNAE